MHRYLFAAIILHVFTGSQATPTTQANYTVYNLSLSVTPSQIVSGLQPVASVITAAVIPVSSTRVYPQACPVGAFSASNSQTCTPCQAGTYSVTPTAGSSVACVACGQGTYSSALGASSASACVNCPLNSYFVGTGAISVSNCTSCPGNSSSNQPYMKSDCICNPGFYGPAGGPCQPCNSSTWCTGGVVRPCPLHSYSPAMSSSLSDCSCTPGYYGDPSDAQVLCQVRGHSSLPVGYV